MGVEIERVSPQSLEIVLVEKFMQAIQDIHSTVSSAGEEDDGDPEKSVITVHSDGTGVHYSDNDCKTHGSEQFYEFDQSRNGLTIIACEFIEYEKLPDNTIDLMRIIGGKIVIKEGMLMQSVNPQLIETAIRRLSKIGEKAKSPANKESVNSDQVPFELPLNPAVLH